MFDTALAILVATQTWAVYATIHAYRTARRRPHITLTPAWIIWNGDR